MATLNSWQKISRVLSSDFGDGASGSATISSDPNTRATFTGTATSTSGTYYSQQAEFSPIGIVTNLVCGSGSNELIMSRRNFYFPGGFSGADTSVLNS